VSTPPVSAFRRAAQALGSLPAGADGVLSPAGLPPLDPPLPLADASPFAGLPDVALAREPGGRTDASDARSARTGSPLAEIERSRAGGGRLARGVDDAIRRGEAGSTPWSGAVAAFRAAGRGLAAMPRGVEGMLAAESALRVLTPDLPPLAASAFDGIREDALPSPRTSERGARTDAPSRAELAPPARPIHRTAPPAAVSAPRAMAARPAADPAGTRPSPAPASEGRAPSDAPPVHRLARRGSQRAADARPADPASRASADRDVDSPLHAARPASSAPALPSFAKSTRPSAPVPVSDGGRVAGVDDEASAHTSSAEPPRAAEPAREGHADALGAALRRVDALARRVMAAGPRGSNTNARPVERPQGSDGASLAEQADALGAGLRQVDALAQRLMGADPRRTMTRAEPIGAPRGAGTAPEPRISAPAPDPFAAWGITAEPGVARVESTVANGAGPAPEPASGNPFAALLAPTVAQNAAGAPGSAASALTHSRTDALTHFGAWGQEADVAAAALDPGALAALVNDALVEQARLHGVDLS
jgi:hypothetical protein